ncbi:MAG TPA: hypothetical protein VGN88_13370 [Phycisphaerae bacterium]|jgi:hypothetical protein
MPALLIDHMTLDLPGIPEPQARRLALGISDGLAKAGVGAAAGVLPKIDIDLTAGADADVDVLIKQVVAEIIGQMRRRP